MVLSKYITLLLLFALSMKPIIADEKLELLFKESNYEALLEEIEDLEDESEDESTSISYDALEYKALSLERTGKYDKAIKTYAKLLKTKFKKQNRKFIRSITKGDEFSFDFDESQRMVFYYTRIAELMVVKYESKNRGVPSKKLEKAKRTASRFIKIIKAAKADEKSDLLQERVEIKERLINSFKYNKGAYVYLSFISWQDYLNINNSAGNAASSVLNTTSGSCSGAGYRWYNDFYEYNVEGCFVLGKSTVSTETGPITYGQSSVATVGSYGGFGLMKRLGSKSLSFGGQLNYLYRSGDWTEPEGAVLDNTSYLRFGFSLRTTWHFSKFGFTVSFGKIFKNKSSLFLISNRYYF